MHLNQWSVVSNEAASKNKIFCDVRGILGSAVDILITLLDAVDGDESLEDDELNDDALEQGEHTSFSHVRPIYALDQSKGPLNA
ncbi:proteasome regulatory subunit Rpn4 [Novosphingobium sp. 9U]|nr:proteasome regulatory subunit Rpn4 [Novosphingobium sp. 9U]